MSGRAPAGGAFDAPTRGVMPSQGATLVQLFRHGDVLGLERREVRGHRDVPVSAEGRRQHEELAAFCAASADPPDVVVSSDLLRCSELAERLAAATGAPLRKEPRLREQSMGAWEGRTWEELTRQGGRAVNDYWDDYVRRRPPGGESLADLADRVGAWWDECLPACRDGRLAVVTHIGPIRVLLCRAFGLDLDQALRWSPPAGSVSRLLVAQAGAVLLGFGERPRLTAGQAGQGGQGGGSLDARPRIALSGSAGTGKTTLGRALAAALDVPFLEEGMRARLEQGLDLHRLGHARLRVLIEELWAEQLAAEDACAQGFVADRSAADFAAFWIHYGFHHDLERTEPWLSATLARVARYDRIVLLPWGVLPLAGDGVRSTNRWVQFMFQGLVEAFLLRHAASSRLLRLPASDDLEERLRWLLAELGASRGSAARPATDPARSVCDPGGSGLGRGG